MKYSLLPLLIVSAQPALGIQEALTQCRKIEEIRERVACYDEIVDSHTAGDSGKSVETGAPPRPAETEGPDALSLFGTNDAEAKRIVAATLAIEQLSQIEATVTDIRKSADKKLTVILDNGQTWRQLDSKPLHLKSGETVVVRKASLGSYLLEKESGSRSIRVRRMN